MNKLMLNNWLTPAPFRNFENEFRRLWDEPARQHFVPAVDVTEHEKNYQFTVSLPGVEKKDIKVEILDDQITIRGERNDLTPTEGQVHVAEITHGTFSRTFTLPTPVSEEGVVAKYDNGLLRLTVPKSAAAKARTIEIQ